MEQPADDRGIDRTVEIDDDRPIRIECHIHVLVAPKFDLTFAIERERPPDWRQTDGAPGLELPPFRDRQGTEQAGSDRAECFRPRCAEPGMQAERSIGSRKEQRAETADPNRAGRRVG
jgi:hypothetical protein